LAKPAGRVDEGFQCRPSPVLPPQTVRRRLRRVTERSKLKDRQAWHVATLGIPIAICLSGARQDSSVEKFPKAIPTINDSSISL